MLAGVLLLAFGAPPAAPEEPQAPSVSESRKDALARYGTGLWQARRDRLLTAIKSLEAAAKQDPDSTAPLKELIAVYAQIGREPDAIRMARTVLEREPHDPDTAHTLARLLNDSGEVGEAVSFAKVAAEHIDASYRPEKALAIYRDLATLLDKAGDAAGAVDAWKLAVDLLTSRRKAIIATVAFTPQELDVETADAFERLGKALVKHSQPDAAAEAFLSAHKLYADPKRVNDRNAAARLEWNLAGAFAEKNPAAALAHLEAFLKLQPQSVDPYERLVALLNRVERNGDIVPELQKYAAQEPANASLRAVLAAEQSRDPVSRSAADAAFAKLLAQTNDPKIVHLAMRSHIETKRAGLILFELDGAYKGLKDDGSITAEARAFAAEKARTIGDILRTEPEWSNAVLGAAADDLRAGTEHPYQTWHALGLLAARHNRLGYANLLFRRAIGTAPLIAQGEVYVQIINVLTLDHKTAELARLCEDALQRDDLLRTFPLYAPLFQSHLSFALARLGKDAEAIAAADTAIAKSADLNRLGYRLGKVQVLGILARWDDAIGLCNKLLAEFPAPGDRVRIRYQLSSMLWGAKKQAEAEAELRTILDADPDHKGAANDLGYHLADQGRNLDEAERLIRRAIAVDRADRRKSGDLELESAPYLDSLAWLLFRKGKTAEARDLLEKVIAMPEGATDGVVWDHLGDVRFRLGDKDKARAAWGEAAKLLAADPRGKRDGRLDDVTRKLKRLP